VSVIVCPLARYDRLCDGAENRRRLALWENTDCGLRGETQWHGVPADTTDRGRPMPVTAECLEKMWEQVLRMDLRGCRAHRIMRDVARSSGTSLLLGGEPDLARLARWVQRVREVQAEEKWK
jgi:hypothetical protein